MTNPHMMMPMQHQQMDIPQRRILPQGVQMQTINFAPSDDRPRENQRNYVFVDEHNRHKRLKVMRACEGCRRRKIKCDAATTNTWPCSACVRLKLPCVPPMVQYDRPFQANQSDLGEDFDGQSSSEDEFAPSQPPIPSVPVLRKSTSTGNLPHYIPRDAHNMNVAQMPPHNGVQDFIPIQYSSVNTSNEIDSSLPFTTSAIYSSPPLAQSEITQQWAPDSSISEFQATNALGQLKIDDRGVATYIGSQGRELARAPAYDEPWDHFETNPVFIPGQHDYAVRIKPEDMPTDAEAENLFAIFFSDIHPYHPIVNKAAFYRQWRTNRHSISPLLLEAIFACAGRISSNPATGLKWISLASKHIDCFFDVPRMSTVQALILILKARESAPQRGYFFRSYMSVVTMMAMARDLGLDKHAEMHTNTGACLDGPLECITKTRVWQSCFTLELLICAPQGRHVLSSDPNTVDLVVASSLPDLDEKELAITRDYTYLMALVKTIRGMNDTFSRLKDSPTTLNWQADPEFFQYGEAFDQWAQTLPPNLQIEVPLDLSIPMPLLESHFAGNVQIYGHLARIMFHRPMINFLRNMSPPSDRWRLHLERSYMSSRIACRLTEALIDQYGLRGLKCMMRGVNFYIYVILTCTMVNLIAATCPDPEFNSDAREYFTRSMRILEQCIDVSASSETKVQIEALRQAFSQDVSQPFVLNPAFPFYTSPNNRTMSPSNSATGSYSPAAITQTSPSATHTQIGYVSVDNRSHSLSSPAQQSISSDRNESPVKTRNTGMHGNTLQQRPKLTPDAGWNPSGIFDHWATGFPGIASAPLPSATLPFVPENALVETIMPNTYMPLHNQTAPHAIVTPDAWQSTVAQVFSGTKRSWQYANQ